MSQSKAVRAIYGELRREFLLTVRELVYAGGPGWSDELLAKRTDMLSELDDLLAASGKHCRECYETHSASGCPDRPRCTCTDFDGFQDCPEHC